MGVHQRIDKIARKKLAEIAPVRGYFPSAKDILHFEGLNGPDGIKRKSPGQDEPWHYINPKDPNDTELIVHIENHIHNLTSALRVHDKQRASFEAAWLAHAITDGLTPAHHYPLEEKLIELRGGADLTTRNSITKKILIPGSSKKDILRNNWEYWGAKGVMTTHFNFELGVATSIVTGRISNIEPTTEEISQIITNGYREYYLSVLKTVDDLHLYETFSRKGWTSKLASSTRKTLIPVIIKSVTLAWLACVLEARAGESNAGN